jgi:hypothetical protein
MEVSFLGYVILVEGIAFDPNKVQEVLEWKSPRSVMQIRSFLGLAYTCRGHVSWVPWVTDYDPSTPKQDAKPGGLSSLGGRTKAYTVLVSSTNKHSI